MHGELNGRERKLLHGRVTARGRGDEVQLQQLACVHARPRDGRQSRRDGGGGNDQSDV